MKLFMIASGLLLCLTQEVLADNTFILATGRRDPRIYAIDLEEALKPKNNNTPNAIVSRSKVALDRLDGRPLGDPANIVVSEDRKTAYVVNHHGATDNAEFLQHGGRGNIAVMTIRKMIRRQNDNTAEALERHIDSGHFGSVGLVLLPDMFIIGNAESHLTEDGGNRITFVDRKTGSLRGEVELALGNPMTDVACPKFPVPFISPSGPPTFKHPFLAANGTFSPVPLLSPHLSWGCFPDTNGITLGRGMDGKFYLFTANGGTDDVSVIDLEQALAGNKTPEIVRIPTQIGPWGITTSPDGRWVVAANRESQRVAFEGNTISIIDVDLARVAASNAEVARVLVGTNDPDVQTRPFIPSFTPDGQIHNRAQLPREQCVDRRSRHGSRCISWRRGHADSTDPPARSGWTSARCSAERLGGYLGRPLRGHLRWATNYLRAERDGVDHRSADAHRCRYGDGRRQRPLWSYRGGIEMIIEL